MMGLPTAAVMCLVWMSRLHVLEFGRALVVAWVAGCVLFASASLLPMLGATPARTVLTVAAALSVIRVRRLFFPLRGGRAFGAGRGELVGRVRAPSMCRWWRDG